MDCSCGMGIPAMGVLIKNKENTKYQFHIGVDPSPITALERCLTELFQGRTAILFKDFNLKSLIEKDSPNQLLYIFDGEKYYNIEVLNYNEKNIFYDFSKDEILNIDNLRRYIRL